MFQTLLYIAAFASVISVVVFIVVYSTMYDWHKSPIGRVMNASLIAVSIAALGIVLRDISPDLGRIVSMFGWGTFAALTIWGLRILVLNCRSCRDKIRQSKDLKNSE